MYIHAIFYVYTMYIHGIYMVIYMVYYILHPVAGVVEEGWGATARPHARPPPGASDPARAMLCATSPALAPVHRWTGLLRR